MCYIFIPYLFVEGHIREELLNRLRKQYIEGYWQIFTNTRPYIQTPAPSNLTVESDDDALPSCSQLSQMANIFSKLFCFIKIARPKRKIKVLKGFTVKANLRLLSPLSTT